METPKSYLELNVALKVGDVILYTSKCNCFTRLEITRIEEKSIYLNGNRNSYGTFQKLMKLQDFALIRK